MIVNVNDIRVVVEDGTIIPTGAVPNSLVYWAVNNTARDTHGIKAVENRISIDIRKTPITSSM